MHAASNLNAVALIVAAVGHLCQKPFLTILHPIFLCSKRKGSPVSEPATAERGEGNQLIEVRCVR